MRSRAEKDAELERLVPLASAGDEEAWRDLWTHLEPRLARFVRRTGFMARLGGGYDDAGRDVVVAVMSRLRDGEFHRLRVYLEARQKDPGLTFMRWLIVVTRRVAIDCLRAHPDYVDRRRSKAPKKSPGTWIETEALPADRELSGGRPPMTNRVAARQILRYASGVLTPSQQRALGMWAEQASLDDIALALALEGPDAAERLVRAAVERLRRHFRPGPAR